MKERSTITVKEWFFNKMDEESKRYGLLLLGEYKDGMLDHTKLRVEQILGETEKAFKVMLDAETYRGNWKGFTTWIPKSVIEEA